jgi:lipopolysaccharide biosynthesis regulator YciM
MELDYWWLLALPLFFGLGWLAARIDIRHVVSASRSLPASYYKGLNFLLNEQPDKAIEAFIEVVKVDSDTVELHFALGHLFRRRGEVERAIRMHQNLLERPNLPDEQRLTALFELGQDYLKAGLLDRAEQTFSDLLPTHYERKALQFLLEIYEQEKEWLKAVDVAHKLAKLTNRSWQKEIAEFYCEMALVEHVHSNPEAARQHLDSALAAQKNCVRANVLAGDFEAAANRHETAIQAWKRIEMQQPDYLSLVAEKLLNAFRELGRKEEGLTLLKGYLEKYPSLDLLDVVYQAILETQGADETYRLVRDDLRRNPTLQGLDKLLEIQLLEAPLERRPDMQLIKNLVHAHAQRVALYHCESCGFKARQYFWHCPACGNWETFPPHKQEETEANGRM